VFTPRVVVGQTLMIFEKIEFYKKNHKKFFRKDFLTGIEAKFSQMCQLLKKK
jgi:hypothetical protein